MTEAERIANWLAETGSSLAHQEAAALLRAQAAEIERRREQHAGAEFAVNALKAEIEDLRELVEMWKATANATVDFDAIRYRWFSGVVTSGEFDRVEKAFACFEDAEECTKEQLDAAIDEAMKGEANADT